MKDAIVYFVLFAALAAAFLLIPKRKKTKRAGVILLCFALVFELVVVNFHSFVLLFGNYEKTEIDFASETVSAPKTSGTSVTVEIRDIGKPVETIFLACDLPPVTEEGKGTPYVNVAIDAKDSTHQGYYRTSVAQGQIVRGDARTAYLLLNLSGDVSDLRVRLTAKSKCEFELTGITLNASVPVRFSAVRLALFVGAAVGIWALASLPSMTAEYEKKRLFCRRVALTATVVLMLIATVQNFLCQYDTTGGISGGFAQTTGNQITKELVDAFEAGRVSLLRVPSEDLLQLENPYDWSLRSSQEVSAAWDHLLYEGKYYSYYGIAPVLLLFLPYHLITGFYFPTAEAVLLFGALGILFLSLLYLTFCDLYAGKIPVNMVLSGLLICQVSCGIWYCFCAPLFYEIAQSSGFLFTCAGWYFLLRAGLIGRAERIRLGSVVAGTVCLSLAVLCRPTLALYCVAALVFLFFGLLRYRMREEERSAGNRRTVRLATVRYLFAALTGFVVIGGVQMAYNYARFGSILDFGIQYSLTINDFTRSQFHMDLVWIGLHNFLFAFPSVKPAFPYVFPNFSDLDLNGYYFIANKNAIGIFFRALPAFGYLAAVPAYRALTSRERRRALWLILPVCILAPLVIIASIWESGYGVRYCVDFSWQIVLGGLAILFLLYTRRAEGQTKRLMSGFLIVSAVLAVVCNFGLIYEYLNKSGYLESRYLSFARLFDFWK